MTEPFKSLIEALRQELQQYGEMLARLDQQQQFIISRAADDVLASAASIQDQAGAIQDARLEREQRQRDLARFLHQPEQATLAQMSERIPSDYRPLIGALVDENNELLARVQHRARQNHLLLHRSLELMQELLQSLFPVGHRAMYDGSGNSFARNLPACALYDAAG